MKHIIISFKSRNSLFSFVKVARGHGLNLKIVNTPRIVSVSCGLSAKTDFNNYHTIINILSMNRFADLLGVFLFQTIGTSEQVQRLY